MKFITTAIIGLSSFLPIQNVKNYRRHPFIRLNELNCTITDVRAKISITREYQDSLCLVYYIYAKYGGLRFEIFNEKHELKEQGTYAGDGKIFYEKLDVDDVLSQKMLTINQPYFKPNPTGTWLFFSKEKKVVKKEIYKNGVLLQSS